MTFEQARAEYLRHITAKQYARQTKYLHMHYLDKFILFVKEKQCEDMNDIRRQHLEEYIEIVQKKQNPLTGKALSQSCIFHHIQGARLLLNHLYKSKQILVNPAAFIQRIKNKRILPKNIPSEAEMKKIIELPDTRELKGIRDRAIMELMYSTGLRRQEVFNLNLYDINLQERTVRVNKGKGNKDRVVPLGSSACKWVQRYIEEGRNKSLHFRCRGKPLKSNLNPALFMEYRGLRLTANGLLILVSKYIRQIKPNAKQACHLFRHAFATHMLKHQANLRAIQEILGHQRISTTEIYTHIKPEDLKTMLKKSHPHGRLKKNKKIIL